MASNIRESSFYDFGSFRIDIENRLLLNRGEVVTLQPKTFDVLLLLVENRGRLLSKDELMLRIWPDAVVEESNLTQNIYVLRKLFSTDASGTKYIETMTNAAIVSWPRLAKSESVARMVCACSRARAAGAEDNVISFPHAVARQEEALPALGIARDPNSEKESDRSHTLSEAERRPLSRISPSRRKLPKLLLAASLLLILAAAAYLFAPRKAAPLKPNSINRSIAVRSIECRRR